MTRLGHSREKMTSIGWCCYSGVVTRSPHHNMDILYTLMSIDQSDRGLKTHPKSETTFPVPMSVL